MDLALARTAIDELLYRDDNAAKDVSITWWGGEPLAAFDTVRTLVLHAEQRARDTGRTIRFGMPTNLTLLTEPILDFLLDHKVNLSLSLDGGARAQGLRRLRGGGSSFPLVLEKLALLRTRLGSRMPGVRMTISPANVDELFDNVSFFLDQGMTHVSFAPVVEVEWTQAQLNRYEQELGRLADHWMAALRAGNPWHATTWNKALARRELIRRGRAAGPAVLCGAGTTSLAVDIYGDIFPCHRYVFYDKADRAEALGNVNRLSAEEGIPQSVLDVERVCMQGEQAGSELPATCQQLCPALNFALVGDRHVVPARLVTLTEIEETALHHLESHIAREPCFRAYLDDVILRNYKWGELSATTVMLLNRIDPADADELANRADAILERLRAARKPEESAR